MLGRSHRRATRLSQPNSSLPPQFEPRYAVPTQERPRPTQDLPLEDPPEYTAARVPTVPVSYAFVPVSLNAMILIPPPDAPDTRPVYHISTGHNCFIPSSYITTIRRGGPSLTSLWGILRWEYAESRPPCVCEARNPRLSKS
ncbi:hypothetical protein BD779DRAFT_1174828 [Infundibulicybe gibba]|nr:hypothetical protein BD779DRAFT_1174828 [Infundibulicybe gibba]